MKRTVTLATIALLALALAGCRGNTPAAALRVDDRAPAFSLPSADGTPVALAAYLGTQPVLLYFHMGFG